MERLNEEQSHIASTDILEWFKENAKNRYDNIRLFETRLENAIYDEPTEEYVFKSE